MSTSNPMLDPNSQQQQLLPPLETTQQAYAAHSGRGHVGPVIGVLVMITVLVAIAVMIGRLCSGRKVMGHLQYDFEGWIETKCASCIDGRVEPPPRRLVAEQRVSGEALDEESKGEELAENHQGERAQS